ncbi:type IV pilus modification protein PilV [Leucothrix pacifica]|uniref:Type IV pilus modification protein PilV n=1 Tax=Leucothrix pacifica TaxID=1247513 RepID=A0A317CJ75_9GAMM|nr:type IV pilus modification protein PilV [Leucothrix pacifica]PWQ98608.1 type IV pilus modification protein PilV [Leucothrix pacifica]
MVSKPLYRTQRGFSLMEVLVSVIVLSIGLLGLGGLQMTSLKGSNNAHFRTVASLAATDLADRMRANPIAVAAAHYESAYVLATCKNPPEKLCESTVLCTPEELADYDVFRVNCGVSDDGFQTGGAQYDLPEAFMSVSCASATCTSGIEHTIEVRWNEADDSDADNKVQQRTYELDFVP